MHVGLSEYRLSFITFHLFRLNMVKTFAFI